MVEQPALTGKPRTIYLLPNLFTTAGLFSSFYGIIAAINQQFEAAVIAIFIAMLWDALDGRIARMTNTQSAFGCEYDSLSDMISFGLAPALTVYIAWLHQLGKLGWLAAFMYTAGTGLRLARFNLQVGKSNNKRYFTGLASPAAAAIVIGFVWTTTTFNWEGMVICVLAALLTSLSGLLMVSNFQYRSFKDLDWRQNVPFIVLLAFVLSLVIIALSPAIVSFALAILYGLSAPILRLRSRSPITFQEVLGEEPATENSDDSSFPD